MYEIYEIYEVYEYIASGPTFARNQRNATRDCYLLCPLGACFLQTANIQNIDRRKFRSQTSDSVDKWKSRGGKSQRREEQKREDQRREREKVGKSRNTLFSQWFVAPEGRKVGSLKRRVRSHLGRWQMKNCGPLWREARLEVKMLKTLHVRSTFGSAKRIFKSKRMLPKELGAGPCHVSLFCGSRLSVG